MTTETRNVLQQEWMTLHQSYEKSETLAFVIKLVSVIVCLSGFVFYLNTLITSLLLCVLWLLEAIWKTFQGRTEQRLLSIEKAWQQSDANVALNFYQHWSASRPGSAQLIGEYFKHAIRPTIAFPYLVLIPLCIIL